MKVLFLISYYKIGDGVSSAIYEFINNSTFIGEYTVLCKWKISAEENLYIRTVDSIEDIPRFLKEEKYDIIHYFRGIASNIFHLIMRGLKVNSQKIPVLTTVCQSPSHKRLLLSPFEMQKSSCLVFIDKASYNDPIISFLPLDRKKQIYLMGASDLCARTEDICFKENKEGAIIYGRGTTLSKCPLNMIEVFDKIDVPNKIFCIVGIPQGDNWVRQKIRHRNDIIVYDLLPYDEWFKICSTFDICLYQIPEDSHASLDANLGLPMLMRKPVVYYGSEAPKERFVHGENGYIANTFEEIAGYATLLGKDETLRRSIGEKARRSTVELIEQLQRKSDFASLYYNLKPLPTFYVPVFYRLKYFFSCYRSVFRRVFNYYN